MTLVVDWRKLDAAIERYIDAGGDFTDVWQDNIKAFRKDQGTHISKQMGDNGPFAPISPATRLRRKWARKGKRRRGNRALTRRLNAALQKRISRRDMELATRVAWAAVHQEGGVVGHNAVIPAREFLYVSKAFEARILTAMALHLRGSWDR